jgi:predicted PurR-regulated permease PerM
MPDHPAVPIQPSNEQQTATLERPMRGRFRALVILALTILGIYVCYLLVLPFVPALVWALVLALLFLPAHEWIEGRVRNRNLAAAASVFLLGVIVVVPGLLLASRLLQEAADGALTLNAKLTSGEWLRSLEAYPHSAAAAKWIDEVDLPEAAGKAMAWFTERSAGLVRASIGHAITLVLTFYLLFYFLRDRHAALDVLLDMSPLPEAEMHRLFRRVADTVYATIYGTLVVAAVQGVLGGLVFWWLALPAPLLWGLVMAALAIVPVLGAFIVWVPTAFFLALNGSWGDALTLTVWGVVVVGGSDNLLYPMLIRDRMRLHTIPAFISVVGGLLLFGASGLILGPVAVTITIFLLRFWGTRIPEPKS